MGPASKEPGHVINEAITAREVRLITEEGEQLGIKPIEEARRLAQEAGRDLVIVAGEAQPPVARIMVYGKFKYDQKKKTHGPHKHQSQLKELRLRPKTDEHDIGVRISQARRFIARGDRVLVNMLFRGREMAHVNLGLETMKRVAAELEDIAKVEKEPGMEHQRLSMILVQK